MRSGGEKVALLVGVLCAIIAAAVPALVVPRFREVFESFGAELPFLTRLFMDHHYVLWLLPVLVIATWFFWPKVPHRSLAACLLGIGSLVLIVPVLVVAMYLPIFQLSTAI